MWWRRPLERRGVGVGELRVGGGVGWGGLMEEWGAVLKWRWRGRNQTDGVAGLFLFLPAVDCCRWGTAGQFSGQLDLSSERSAK